MFSFWQVPKKLEVLELGHLHNAIYICGENIDPNRASDNRVPNSPPNAPTPLLFPALKHARFGVFGPHANSQSSILGSTLIRILPHLAPCLETLDFFQIPDVPSLPSFSFPVAPFSPSELLHLSAWTNLNSLRLENCTLRLFTGAFESQPPRVLLPSLEILQIGFSQRLSVTEAAFSALTVLFPRLQTLGLLHESSEILRVFGSVPCANENGTVEYLEQYQYLVESCRVSNVVSKFSRSHPHIQVEFRARSQADFILK